MFIACYRMGQFLASVFFAFYVFESTFAGNTIASIPLYQAFKNLGALRCSSSYGPGNQDSEVVNTDKRVADFKKTLKTEAEKTYLDRLIASADHDITHFPPDTLRRQIDLLMTSLDKTAQDNFIDIRAQWSTISSNSLKTWPPSLYLLLKAVTMKDLFEKTGSGQVGLFCRRLAEDDVSTAHALAILDNGAYCVMLAVASRQDYSLTAVTSGAKGRAFYQKLTQYQSTKWDVHFLMFAPDAVNEQDVDKITDNANFCDRDQMQRLANVKFYGVAKKEVIEKVARKIRSCLEALSGWTKEQLTQYAVYVVNMPSNRLRSEMTISKVIENMDVFTSLRGAEDFFRIVGWNFETWWKTNSNSLTQNQKTKLICLVVKYAPKKSLLKRLFTVADMKKAVAAAASQCSSITFTRTDMRIVLRRITSDGSFTLSAQTLQELGPFMGSLKSSRLNSLGKSVICDNLQYVKNSDFKVDQLRKLWKKCKSNYDVSTFDCTKIQNVGKLLIVMSKSEINSIPGEALYQCADKIGKLFGEVCKTNRKLCNRMWKKIKAYAKSQNIKLGQIVRVLSSGFLRAVDFSDLETLDLASIGGVDNLKNVDIDSNTAAAIMKLVKTTWGDVTETNSRYSAAGIKKIGVALFFMGSTIQDLENLPEDTALLDLLAKASKYISKLGTRKLEIILKKLLKLYKFDTSSTGSVCIDDALAEQIGMFLARLNPNSLKKLTLSSLRKILRVIGQKYEYVQGLTPNQMKYITETMLKAEGIENQAEYTLQNFEKYGPYIWCGMDKGTASKLNFDVVETHLGSISNCIHYDEDTKISLSNLVDNLYKRLSQNIFDDMDVLKKMAPLLPFISSKIDTLTEPQKEKLSSSISTIMKTLSEYMEKVNERNDREISAAVKQATRDKLKEFVSKVWNKIKDLNFAQASRRKRATGGPTCDALEEFNGHLQFLQPSDISAMTSNDFKDCLPELQSGTYSTEQTEAFGAKLTVVYGSTDLWSENDITTAGKLIDHLSSQEIRTMTKLTSDVILALGRNSFQKDEDIVSTFLSTISVTDPASIDADTLGNMGNLVGGLTSTQMLSLTSKTVNDAVPNLGDVSTLTQSELVIWGQKIVEQRGSDWSNVEPGVIKQLGEFVGGLPPNALEDLGADQIAQISLKAIEKIPPSTFSSVFTVDKLNQFNSDQANAVTDAQRGSLSSDQRNTLESKSTIFVDDTTPNNPDNTDKDSGGTGLLHGKGKLYLVTFVTNVLMIRLVL